MNIPHPEAEYQDHMSPQEIMDWVLMRDIAETLDQMPLDDGIAAEASIGAQRREAVLEGVQKGLEAEAQRIDEDQQALKVAKNALNAVKKAEVSDALSTFKLPDAPFTILFRGATQQSYHPATPAYIAFRSKVGEAIGYEYNLHQAAKVTSMLLRKFPATDKSDEPVSELHPGKGLTILKPSLTPDQVYRSFGHGETTAKLAFKAIQVFTKES